MSEKVTQTIGRLWFEDWAGEPFENLDAPSQALWIARAKRVWEQVRSEVKPEKEDMDEMLELLLDAQPNSLTLSPVEWHRRRSAITARVMGVK